MSAMREAATRATDLLRGKLNGDLLASEQPQPDTLRVEVARKGLRAAAQALVGELGARFLISVGTDWRPTNGGYGISHVFSLDPAHLFVVLECSVPEDDARVDSITPVVPGADWSEREFADVIGVKAEGHPDPRRLLLADDWPEGVYPLRRDFPYDEVPAPATGVRARLADAPSGTSVIPIGPFFPVLEEPSYWRLFVDGESIVGCDYRGFYNHRGIEKMGESRLTYNEISHLAEKICGICGFIHSTCYCQAVEKAAGIEVPPRARYLRTIMLEIERIHSHLLWLGIAGHILGFETVLMQTWRIREPVMWLCEAITGSRKSYAMNTIGGVRRDLLEELEPKILETIQTIEKEALAVRRAIVGDSTLLARTKGVGVLTGEWARKVCVVGPPARASGVRIDARIDHPYAAYDEVPVRIAVDDGCDTWARLVVRVAELLESIRLVREALKALPEGPICAEVTGEIPPQRLGISVVEAPRGEAIHVVWTGGDNRPYRWRVRAPSYPNLQAAPAMLREQTIADVPIIIGSLDPCFSCTERVEAVDVNTRTVKVYRQEDLLGMSRRSGGRGVGS